ncbi:hypothetical protein FTX61_04700 [Nitriliruptoraceae bacterium ZYF776]|nr:hypothetical protein [Profundirhabdus halotolerans]
MARTSSPRATGRGTTGRSRPPGEIRAPGQRSTGKTRPAGKAGGDRSGTGATAKAARRRRPPTRWVGLDVARGTVVLLAVVLGVAAWLAPTAFTAPSWQGLGPVELVPGAFLVLAGVTGGWRADAGAAWTPRRRWQRGAILVTAGMAVAIARAGGELALLGAEELLRLAAATGLAAWLAARHPVIPFVVAPALLLAPAAIVTGDPLGRGLRGLEASAAFPVESALGLPGTSVAALSMFAATGLVLVGHGLGRWMHRRPPGPASGGALLTVAGWATVGTVAAAQVIAPVPSLLTLPVAAGSLGLAALTLGVGHLAVAAQLPVGAVAATGRVALVPATAGAVLGALLPAAGVALPPVAAATAGGLVAAAVGLLALHLLDRWPLRA